jgi:hypothetical protein
MYRKDNMIITRTENKNHYWFFNKTDRSDDC